MNPPLTDPRATERVADPLPIPTTCPFCQSEVILVHNSAIYGRAYGDWPWAYKCTCCEAYIGLHPKTLIPLGTLADATLRTFRRQAHQAFDPIWKGKHMHRTTAYIWLAMQLKINPSACHIGYFDAERCMKTVLICENYLKGKS